MVSQDRPTFSSGQPPSPPNAPIQDSTQRPRRARGAVLLGGILVIGAIALYHLLAGHGSESEVVVGKTVHTIQLDVLNSTGETKLAQRMTDYLRSRGFDVVELGNYSGELAESFVVDRSGNRKAAEQVASVIGVGPEHVVQKIDKSLYLDVSVYIGKDFKSLRPFK